MERKQKGFSLIELLVVVTIILVIAAIAIPNLIRSRMSANEASAVASMRTVLTAEIVYSATYTVGFAASLTSLSDGGTPSNCVPPAIPLSSSACLLDASVASGTKSGYLFTYVPVSGASGTASFRLNADPLASGSGQRHFYTDDTAVLRVNNTVAASASDTPL
jgi:prepilin-type N-terminal cleavage/methylation domain-containing protein